MPRLLLVNVADREVPGFSSFRISRIPPLGLAYVAAVTPPDWTVRVVDENVEPFFSPGDADLVGLSSMTPDIRRAYRIARDCGRAGVPVVMGGIHASMLPEEALGVSDSVVIGEAEKVWPRVLDDFLAGRLEREYRGTWDPLDHLPLPRRDLFPSVYRTATVQTARGCPFGCEFCSVSRFNGGRYRTRPVREVLDELSAISRKALFFVDDNLFGTGGPGRERALELFRGMVDRGLRRYWFGQTSLEMAGDSELLAWAARSGCKLLLIGFESLHEGSLRQMDKRINLGLDPRRYRASIRAFHRHGIAVWGGFVFGMDGETVESIDRTHRFLRSSRLDVVQLTAVTPLPGTRLYERLAREGRIRYTGYPDDWRRYSFMECVIVPDQVSGEELDRKLRRMRDRFWGSVPYLLARFFRTLWDTRSVTAALAANKMNRAWRTIHRRIYAR
jgi:radical SAM superfamily enzyme YgiQ (UPF0313 family)